MVSLGLFLEFSFFTTCLQLRYLLFLEAIFIYWRCALRSSSNCCYPQQILHVAGDVYRGSRVILTLPDKCVCYSWRFVTHPSFNYSDCVSLILNYYYVFLQDKKIKKKWTTVICEAILYAYISCSPQLIHLKSISSFRTSSFEIPYDCFP